MWSYIYSVIPCELRPGAHFIEMSVTPDVGDMPCSLQSVQLKVTQLLHIVAKLSRVAPPAVGIGGSDQLRSWGSFWVAKTVF